MSLKNIPPLHPSVIVRMSEYNLVVEEGQDLKPAQFNLADLKFKFFLKKSDNGRVEGEELRRRAVTMKGNLGLADAKNLLDQLNSHSNKRKDLQDKYIVLPNTFLRGSDDHLRVAFLYWRGDCWVLDFYWLDYGWSDRDCFACSE